MAYHIAAQITIGGCISRKLVPRLCRAIRQERLALEWGITPFEPRTVEDLLAARQVIDGELVLRLCEDEARYGEFEQLEPFLTKQGIAFDRTSEASYEALPRLVVYRPQTGTAEWLTTMGRDVLVPAAPVWDLQTELEAIARQIKSGRCKMIKDGLALLAQKVRDAAPVRPDPLTAFEIGKTAGLRHAA